MSVGLCEGLHRQCIGLSRVSIGVTMVLFGLRDASAQCPERSRHTFLRDPYTVSFGILTQLSGRSLHSFARDSIEIITPFSRDPCSVISGIS